MITQGNTLQPLSRPRSRLRYLAPAAIVLPLLIVAAFIVLAVSAHASLRLSGNSLGRVSLPFGTGTVERAVAVGGPEQGVVPVQLRGDEVWPTGKLTPGEKLTVDVTVKRPGWISWLAGSTEQVKLTETAPTTAVTSQFVTRRAHQPVTVHFSNPVEVIAYGRPGSKLHRRTLSSPQSSVSLNEGASAGTILVAGAARNWERMKSSAVSWFPAGAKASAVASPAPGTRISPTTGITVTFSRPVSKVLGKNLPPVRPADAGSWHKLDAHTIRFVPTGYGYGLGAQVQISLPSGVRLVGGTAVGSDPVGKWSVPAGSTLRLQQLLATLGYLPVNFHPATTVGSSITDQEAAAVKPPSGSFSWRYPNTPTALKQMWSPTNWTELTKGAVMAFEQSQGLTTDGVAGPEVWKALLAAADKGKKYTFGYTFVHVTEGSPERIVVWHNGKDVVTGPANTGIPAAPTAVGTYAVYEHIPSGTMSGKNPDGSTYHDTGIPWISYFNGGDALHGFLRSSYGTPQSLGCVEMPYAEAGQVYPYTPIGTIVNIVS